MVSVLHPGQLRPLSASSLNLMRQQTRGERGTTHRKDYFVEKQAQKLLVTAALPYANGPLHVGHLAGAYIPADVYVRYKRLKGADILFVCGSDEHGVPITIRADREGITPKEVVDREREKLESFAQKLEKLEKNLEMLNN